MKVLNGDDVKRVLPMKEAIAANREAFRLLATPDSSNVPSRIVLGMPDQKGATLFKPAWVKGNSLGLKVVSVRPDNAAKGLPTVPGVVLLVDEVTAVPTALLDATYLTALRTAAGSAVATELVASPDARVLGVLGAGLQARLHIEAMLSVRPGIEEVVIYNRTVANAEKLAADVAAAHGVSARGVTTAREAVRRADIVVAATNTSASLWEWADMMGDDCGAEPLRNVHINAVGAYTPSMQEVGNSVMEKLSLAVIDSQAALSVGEFVNGASRPARVVELGDAVLRPAEVASAAAADGKSRCRVTLFKSVGTAIQDIVTAAAAVEAANRLGVGQAVNI